MKKILGKALILLLLVLVGAAIWYMTRQRPLLVDVATIEENVEIKVFGLGTVEARILSRTGFKVSNTLIELNVDEGDHVSKGEVLARLDSTEQKARLAKAYAGVSSADATVKGAQSAILKAKAIVATKKQTQKRKQVLFEKQTLSSETLDAAELEVATAQAELSITQSSLLTAKAALKTAQAQLELEEAILSQYELKAPYSGVVIARHMELGTVVKVGEPLFTLADPQTVWVLGYISENRSGLIRVDQPADIQLRSRPHAIHHGKVQRINIESDRVTEERRI